MTSTPRVSCEAVAETQVELREREWRELALAAHWAVLHSPETLPARTGPAVPGVEGVKQLGGPGTPRVTEFACAELAVLMGTGFISADNLMRDALDLQHRHPHMWAALAAGQGRVWKARKVAKLVHAAGLDLTAARMVDAATTPHVDTLAWASFERLVTAEIIAVDPTAAEERRRARELEQFVAAGQSDEHGLKTLIARAEAGEVIVFLAMCDRIAQILALEGDTSPVGARRARAIGILAQPATALALLQRHATRTPTTRHHRHRRAAPTPTTTGERTERAPRSRRSRRSRSRSRSRRRRRGARPAGRGSGDPVPRRPRQAAPQGRAPPAHQRRGTACPPWGRRAGEPRRRPDHRR